MVENFGRLSVFASGVADAALGNAAFFALVEKADALDDLKGLLRETVRKRARELAAVNAASGM